MEREEAFADMNFYTFVLIVANLTPHVDSGHRATTKLPDMG